MIKVLHVLGHVPIGGVGTFLINTLKYIDKDEISFDFIMFNSSHNSDFTETVIDLGAKVHKFESHLTIKYIFKIKTEVEEHFKMHKDYDIIHIHSPNIGMFVLPAAKKAGIPIRILHSHSTKYSNSKVKSIRNFILDISTRSLVTDFVACSENAGNFLFKRNAYTVIPNGINIKSFAYDQEGRIKMRNVMGVEDRTVIGHVGNFDYQKNHELLIDIFYEIYKKDKGYLLYLVGNGYLEEKIREKVKKMGLVDSVKFMGRRRDIPNLMQAFDIFVLPSKFEGFGIVCIEAQASGLQCFASKNVPMAAKVTDNISFLDINSPPEQWAERIMSIAGYQRKDMSSKVKKEGYDIQDTSKKLQDHYLSLVRNR